MYYSIADLLRDLVSLVPKIDVFWGTVGSLRWVRVATKSQASVGGKVSELWELLN